MHGARPSEVPVGFHLSNLIYGSIHFNKNLKSVNIADNNLTSNAVEPITIAFHNNVYVKSFDISNNYLLEKGAILLGNMLHRNRHLTSLNVSNCRLTDFGKISMVSSNCVLVLKDIQH